MIKEEKYKIALILRELEIKEIDNKQLEIATILFNELHSDSKSFLEKLKEECIKRKLEFQNEEYKMQGKLDKGNSKTVTDNRKLVEKIGLDNFLDVATVSEKAIKDRFGEEAEEVTLLKESSKMTPSEKDIYKLTKWVPKKPKK
jgi:hypothetical protein